MMLHQQDCPLVNRRFFFNKGLTYVSLHKRPCPLPPSLLLHNPLHHKPATCVDSLHRVRLPFSSLTPPRPPVVSHHVKNTDGAQPLCLSNSITTTGTMHCFHGENSMSGHTACMHACMHQASISCCRDCAPQLFQPLGSFLHYWELQPLYSWQFFGLNGDNVDK